MRYLTLFFALMLILPTVLADDYIFEDWVKEGESFEVKEDTYAVSAGVTVRSAILMGPTGVFVIEEGDCRTVNKLRFCLDEFRYTVGGNISIHGMDTKEFYITIEDPGAELRIDRDISSSDITVGERATMTVQLENNGEEGVRGIYYEEIIPPEFEITNSYGFERHGNRLWWRGGIPAMSYKEFMYDIEAKEEFSGQIHSSMTYTPENTTNNKTSRTSIKVNPLFNINFMADDYILEPGEETRIYTFIESNKNIGSDFELEVAVPGNLEVQDSHMDIEDSTLSWEGSIGAGDEKNFTTSVKAMRPGTAVFTAGGRDMTSRSSPLCKNFTVTVLRLDPEIYFIHRDIIAGEPAKVSVYLKNPSFHIPLKNLEVAFSGKYFSETGFSSEFVPKEYNPIVTAEFVPDEPGTFNIMAEVNYTLKGRAYNATKDGAITVKEKPAEAGPEANITGSMNESEEMNLTTEMNQTEEPGINGTEDNMAAEPEEKGVFESFFARLREIIFFWR